MEKQIRWSLFTIREGTKGPEVSVIGLDGEESSMSFMSGMVYNTIIGPIDMLGGNSILDHFNLWVMNTNFAITEKQYDDMGYIDGVELLYPLSKYKAIVGIGQLFFSSNVKVEIEHYLTGKHKEYLYLLQLEEPYRLTAINTYQSINKFPYWIMYIIPNGNIEHYYTTVESEYEDKLLEFKKYKEISNGILLYGTQVKQ